MLKQDLTLRSMSWTGHKKVIGTIKDNVGDKIVREFVRLKSKTYSDLIDDGSHHTLISEISLRKIGFTYSACGALTKKKTRIQKFKEKLEVYPNLSGS